MIEVRLSNDALVRLATYNDGIHERPKTEWFSGQQWWIVKDSNTLINTAHVVAVIRSEV